MKHLIEINFPSITLFQIQNAIRSLKKINAYPVFYIDTNFNPFIFEKYLLCLKNYKSKGYIIINKLFKSYKSAEIIISDYNYNDKIIYELPINFIQNYISNSKDFFNSKSLKNNLLFFNKIRKNIKRLYKNNFEFIPSLKLGYDISNFNSCFEDKKYYGVYNSDFNYVRYTYNWPGKNVAGGLFNSDGTIIDELQNDIIKKIEYFNKLDGKIKLFIPHEYFYNDFINDNIFEVSKNIKTISVFTNINLFIKTWQKIIFPLKGELSYIYKISNIQNEKTIIVPGLEWISKETEKCLLDYCISGNTLIMDPQLPKYDEDGNFSGLLIEHTLKSKEIVYGYKNYFLKLYQIGRGCLVLFDFGKNKNLDLNHVRNLVNRVL